MRRPFLAAVASIMAVYWALAIYIAAVDPYDLYAWSAVHPLRSSDEYSLQSAPYLVDAAAKSTSIDTIFLGGSTGHFYTSQMMQDILPNTRRAFNLSYASPSPADRSIVQRQLLLHSHARRFILEADWTYIIPKETQRPSAAFPVYLYDDVRWNDFRAVTRQSIQLSLGLMRGGPLWIENWSRMHEREGYQHRFELLHSAHADMEFAGYVSRNKASINTPSELSCTSMNELGEGLIPFVSSLAQRGAEVDVLLPLYSWMLYYWTGRPDQAGLSRPSLLNDALLLRDCLVQALDGMPGVRIFAFDDVPGLASDLRNYFDPGHLYNPAANRYVLQSIARGEHRLTRANVGAKNASMRSSVIEYQFTNAKLWSPPP